MQDEILPDIDENEIHNDLSKLKIPEVGDTNQDIKAEE